MNATFGYVPVILLAALATYATRIGGYLIVRRFERLPPRLMAALDAVPAAVLSTLVAPALITGGRDAAIAIVVAFLAGFRLAPVPMLLLGWAVVMGLRQIGF
ncbi:hypothetical protein BJF92_10575 [Rhizobium rhizosphaerae]|uniref:AzlD family protein n=1 Tax=Xaviernesmea rhizosphaerae TaxID=1672749 RepID=A0A1Q9ANJ7_9HYPH|nr:AzlD domain-containing protein [Xaviernesmea rhizosphaerae]OLP56906.1 hypothetical protein BJF92_10575 [Xaviernesmea rhizosphaerae]OQP87912.1 hypothetical protein BTR14_04675 [Xaviernesmea rhizosphaerae]